MTVYVCGTLSAGRIASGSADVCASDVRETNAVMDGQEPVSLH
jgi:hypothetical protein